MQFSNNDRDVFLVKLDRMIDRGALLSRYSRATSLDIREVYRKEFEGNEDRGKDFYKRVFLEYGDESIAELVTAQLAIQNLSNVMTKTIEELRVGLSYLEKSSRYVRYDKKKDGRYLYLSPEKVGLSGDIATIYGETCDSLFDFYSSSYEPALEFFREKYPIEDIMFTGSDGEPVHLDALPDGEKEDAEKSYRSSIRARALDDLRFLLPASTLTNLGISGNGRAFINLVQKLMSVELPEAQRLAEDVYSELESELPELINSAVSEHGKKLVEYRKQIDSFQVMDTHQVSPILETVELLDNDPNEEAMRTSISILAFSNGLGDLRTVKNAISGLSESELSGVVKKLSGLRKNRRHKLPRAFESVPYLFQITTNYGAFRDLQRHRFISISRQPLSNAYGYDTPEFFAESDLKEQYENIMKKASDSYERIRASRGRAIAQYTIPYAYRYPVTAHLNLREAAFFCELRSTPQAHPDLRNIAISMFRQISLVNPGLAPLIKFVDEGDYALGRLKAEQRKERRMRDLGKD